MGLPVLLVNPWMVARGFRPRPWERKDTEARVSCQPPRGSFFGLLRLGRREAVAEPGDGTRNCSSINGHAGRRRRLSVPAATSEGPSAVLPTSQRAVPDSGRSRTQQLPSGRLKDAPSERVGRPHQDDVDPVRSGNVGQSQEERGEPVFSGEGREERKRGEELQGKEGMSWLELSTEWRAPRREVRKLFPLSLILVLVSTGWVMPGSITAREPEAVPPCPFSVVQNVS